MSYIQQTWVDLPSKTTPINAERLNHMEDGIYDANLTATPATQGQMSANDKRKLDALAQAEVDGTTLII